jgi:hypothetical protein
MYKMKMSIWSSIKLKECHKETFHCATELKLDVQNENVHMEFY